MSDAEWVTPDGESAERRRRHLVFDLKQALCEIALSEVFGLLADVVVELRRRGVSEDAIQESIEDWTVDE